MKLSDLISHVGDENVQFQVLNKDMDEAVMRRGVGKVTFTTASEKVSDMLLENESKWVGFILWIPRERLPQKNAEERNGK